MELISIDKFLLSQENRQKTDLKITKVKTNEYKTKN